MNYFINDDIRIKLTANESLTGATVKVVYVKPFQAEQHKVDPTTVNTENNLVTYDLSASDNNVSGDWRFWLEVVNSDEKKATSSEVVVNVKGR